MEEYEMGKGSPARDRIIRRFVHVLYNLPGDVWVAGGAIRAWVAREPIADIDLWFPTEKDYQAARDRLLGRNPGTEIEDGALSVKIKDHEWGVCDLVKVYHENALKTISQFDFTVTMAAVDKERKFIAHRDFFADVANKRLVLGNPTSPLGTLSRLQRYIKRGYQASDPDLFKLATAIQGSEKLTGDYSVPTNVNVLEEVPF